MKDKTFNGILYAIGITVTVITLILIADLVITYKLYNPEMPISTPPVVESTWK
jgi:hypothetical protein